MSATAGSPIVNPVDDEVAERAAISLARIDERIRERHLIEHPVFSGWRNGTLSRDELRLVATQWYQVVDAFPQLVSQVHAVTRNLSTRRMLTATVAECESTSPTESDLWLQFCASIGLFSDSVRQAAPTPATVAALTTCREVCSRDGINGLAALYAICRQVSVLARMQLRALAEHYGMTQGPGRHYFERLEYAAGDRASRLRNELLARLGDTNTTIEARSAIAAVTNALQDMLDEIVPTQR